MVGLDRPRRSVHPDQTLTLCVRWQFSANITHGDLAPRLLSSDGQTNSCFAFALAVSVVMSTWQGAWSGPARSAASVARSLWMGKVLGMVEPSFPPLRTNAVEIEHDRRRVKTPRT